MSMPTVSTLLEALAASANLAIQGTGSFAQVNTQLCTMNESLGFFQILTNVRRVCLSVWIMQTVRILMAATLVNVLLDLLEMVLLVSTSVKKLLFSTLLCVSLFLCLSLSLCLYHSHFLCFIIVHLSIVCYNTANIPQLYCDTWNFIGLQRHNLPNLFICSNSGLHRGLCRQCHMCSHQWWI